MSGLRKLCKHPIGQPGRHHHFLNLLSTYCSVPFFEHGDGYTYKISPDSQGNGWLTRIQGITSHSKQTNGPHKPNRISMDSNPFSVHHGTADEFLHEASAVSRRTSLEEPARPVEAEDPLVAQGDLTIGPIKKAKREKKRRTWLSGNDSADGATEPITDPADD